MIFHSGDLPEGCRLSFEPTLFNMEAHRRLQTHTGWHSFFALNEKMTQARAAVHIHIQEGVAMSPLRAPFGSFEWDGHLTTEDLYSFFLFVEDQLRRMGVHSITFKEPPLCYDNLHNLNTVFLTNLGYRIAQAETSSCIRVGTEPFADRTNTRIRHKLGLIHSSLTFRELAPGELDGVYDFILRHRTAKGYALSMTLPELKKATALFPDRYLLLAMFNGSRMVAACIAILVHSQVLYYFYADHDREFDSLSPTIGLVEGLYLYCQAKGIAILDLGTSALDDAPNFGLLDFKLDLGADPFPKLTFQKTL